MQNRSEMVDAYRKLAAEFTDLSKALPSQKASGAREFAERAELRYRTLSNPILGRLSYFCGNRNDTTRICLMETLRDMYRAAR